MPDTFVHWLALREPADAAARSVILTRAIAGRLVGIAPLNVVDLGAGTGANLRYLAPQLPAGHRWLLVDRDPRLLAEASARTPASVDRLQCTVETQPFDLEEIGQAAGKDIFAGRHLVTGSALLDLVSDDWLHKVADRCREAGSLVLFALTYTGRSSCSPAEPEDDEVRELLNEHQRAARGIGGPAVGPEAVDRAEQALVGAGYRVRRDLSAWVLPPDMRDLQRRLIEGWARPAIEMAPDQASRIVGWLERRLAHVDAGASHITVGHEDLAAWPA